MRYRLSLGWLMIAASLLVSGNPRAQGCDPRGNVKFVCGFAGPEDLFAVPRTDWVIVSGYVDGAMHLIHSRDYTTTQLFPKPSPRVRPDTTIYGSCPGPIDPAAPIKFTTHGLNLRPGRNGVHTVYVVLHGPRESVEIFEIDTRPRVPALTWIGCVVAPDTATLNSVTPLPEGGLAVTNFARRGNPAGGTTRPGGNTGEVLEWHPRSGWTVVPGSDSPGPNGLEVSRDGKWFYVALFTDGSLMRLSRGQTPVKTDVVKLGFHPDNVHWTTDGALIAAGHAAPTFERMRECASKTCSDAASHVAKIDPHTLKVEDVLRYPSNDLFFSATVALPVGREIWIGSFRGDRIARYPVE